MAAETNQAIVCQYCGRSISHVRQLSLHGEGRCDQAVTEVLSAKVKHGTLGEHHVESVTKRTSKFKDSLDRHYHEIMLAEMTLELVLILVLVILAWKQS